MAVAVGIDIGGTNVRGLPVREDGSVGDNVKIDRPKSAAGLVDVIVALTEQIAAAEDASLASLGVGCAGIVDRQGVVRSSPNIPELVRFPLKAKLTEHFDVPIEIDNDATTAAWAEAQLGVAVGIDDMAFVALGTGIGTGFVLDGQLHRGGGGFAGESGHMTIAHGGIACVCGRQGCWERYASGTAYGRLAIEAAEAGRAPTVIARAGGNIADVRSEHVTELVADDNQEALAIVESLAYWTAVGLANLVNVLDPSMVVIGGGVAEMGQPLVDAIRRQYREVMVDIELRDPLAIELSRFGGRAGAIGAAVLAS